MAKREGAAPLYHKITKDAWRMTWAHQHLWIFGFFATFIGFGGVTEVFLNAYDKSALYFSATGTISALSLVPGLGTVKAIIEFSAFPILSLLIFTAVTAIVMAVFMWIVTVSIGALIHSVRKIERGGDPTFPEALKVGSERFLPLFGVNALMKITISFAFFLTGSNLLAFFVAKTFIANVAFIISFVLFTAIAVLAVLLEIYSSNAVIIDGKDFKQALTKGWDFLKRHWLTSLEMAIVLFIATIIIAITAALIALVLSVPLIFLILLTSAIGAKTAVVSLLTITAVAAVLYVATLGAFVTTFQTAAWSLLWIEVSKKKDHRAHIVHLMSRIQAHRKRRKK